MTWRKRLFDLFFVTLLLVILGPILLGLLLWLLWKEGRPVFYVAERMEAAHHDGGRARFRGLGRG